MQFSGLDTRHSLWVPFYVLMEIFVKFARLNGTQGYVKIETYEKDSNRLYYGTFAKCL